MKLRIGPVTAALEAVPPLFVEGKRVDVQALVLRWGDARLKVLQEGPAQGWMRGLAAALPAHAKVTLPGGRRHVVPLTDGLALVIWVARFLARALFRSPTDAMVPAAVPPRLQDSDGQAAEGLFDRRQAFANRNMTSRLLGRPETSSGRAVIPLHRVLDRVQADVTPDGGAVAWREVSETLPSARLVLSEGNQTMVEGDSSVVPYLAGMVLALGLAVVTSGVAKRRGQRSS